MDHDGNPALVFNLGKGRPIMHTYYIILYYCAQLCVAAGPEEEGGGATGEHEEGC